LQQLDCLILQKKKQNKKAKKVDPTKHFGTPKSGPSDIQIATRALPSSNTRKKCQITDGRNTYIITNPESQQQ
jgi:hypothetical protein